VVLATVVVTAVGLAVLGVPPEIALVVAAVATSTDPVAVSDVVRETRAEGPFTRTLLGVVAVDDAWGLVAVSVLLAAALALGGRAGPEEAVLHGLRDLGGATAVGLALGVPLALLTGRVRPGEPTLAEALGAVLLCGGVAKWLDVSFLLAAMVMGAVVANLARHHRRPFRAIEGIEWPFMVLFFVLAGASFRLDGLGALGGLAVGYLVLRTVGRLAGGWLGARLLGRDGAWRRWTGLALLPQAGVALGMALVVAQRFPELGRAIVPAVVATTVLFELVGPILTRRALEEVGETGRAVTPGAEPFGPEDEED
jgi:Kef-type K+ transport system membrane component KefB